MTGQSCIIPTFDGGRSGDCDVDRAPRGAGQTLFRVSVNIFVQLLFCQGVEKIYSTDNGVKAALHSPNHCIRTACYVRTVSCVVTDFE